MVEEMRGLKDIDPIAYDRLLVRNLTKVTANPGGVAWASPLFSFCDACRGSL